MNANKLSMYVLKPSGLNHLLKASSIAIFASKPGQVPAGVAPNTAPSPTAFLYNAPGRKSTGHTLCRYTSVPNQILATSGMRSAGSVRFAHSDIKVPDFSYYRRDGLKDPEKSARDTHAERHSFTYLITVGG